MQMSYFKLSTKHFNNIADLSENELHQLLKLSQKFSDNNYPDISNILTNKAICLAFFEPSTRTRCGFELAAKRLGAMTVNFLDPQGSSIKKGETLLDTVRTFEAMNIDALVFRHWENFTPDFIAEHLPNFILINAGDGTHAHPTQALIDMLTIQQCKDSNWNHLKVAIVGDIIHSRTARSQLAALKLLNVSEIRLVGPKEWIPSDFAKGNVSIHHDLASGIADVDVVMLLRIQRERLAGDEIFPDKQAYHEKFGLNASTLAYAKPDAILMHPGPLNRGIEIADDVADGPQSVILKQVQNSVPVRMAVFTSLLA